MPGGASVRRLFFDDRVAPYCDRFDRLKRVVSGVNYMGHVRAHTIGPATAAIWSVLPDDALHRFAGLVRRNALFAVCEISKGVVIVGLGDFATADAVGELVTSAAPTAAHLVASLALLSP
jgi:hypothetical protein